MTDNIKLPQDLFGNAIKYTINYDKRKYKQNIFSNITKKEEDKINSIYLELKKKFLS